MASAKVTRSGMLTVWPDLAEQGWEPISVTSTYPKATVGVLFKRA